MSDGIHISGPIGFMESSNTAVTFSNGSSSAGAFTTQGTAPLIKKAQTALEVAYWGEDNRFPQNIENQMSYFGIGKSALDWKARALFGGGIIPGRIADYTDDGKTEVFKPLTRAEGKDVYAFLEQRSMFRFWMEFFQDWTWFGNCFPETILSADGKKITGFVHQESCDVRYKQMNDAGEINTAYLSKMWGTTASQFARFDPQKKILGILENPMQLTAIDNKFLKVLDCIDMYDQVDSLKTIADRLVGSKGLKGLKSAILPVNYPSPNKTYYQVAYWDGARLGGWIEIACKIPSLIKLFLQKGLKVQNHIEIPKSYFEDKYGKEIWKGFDEDTKKLHKGNLLKEMDVFLTSDKASFSTFISFFDYDNHNKTEFNRIKFTPIESKYSVDKELITTSAADLQFLAAAQVHPTLFGAGTIGTGTHRSGGSDQREAFIIYNAMLTLERQVALEPLYLARDYNQWGDDIVFRIRDTQLTTLDQNTGSKKIIS